MDVFFIARRCHSAIPAAVVVCHLFVTLVNCTETVLRYHQTLYRPGSSIVLVFHTYSYEIPTGRGACNVGGLKSKISNFLPLSRYIVESVNDRAEVTVER